MSIPHSTYIKILKNVPIATVDLVIFDEKLENTLLFYRSNEPAKDIYYTMGGRILKNELAHNAVKRKLKEELNINKEVKYQFVSVTEEMFDTSIYPDVSTHNVNLYYACVFSETEMKDMELDCQHTAYKWFNINKLDELHSYVKDKIMNAYKKLKVN